MENIDMENKKCEGGVCPGGSCGCGSCGDIHSKWGHGCHGGKHHLVKMILKIMIVILIFWCGFKLGEMTGFIKAQSGYGYGMMRVRNYNNLPNTTNTVPTPVAQ